MTTNYSPTRLLSGTSEQLNPITHITTLLARIQHSPRHLSPLSERRKLLASLSEWPSMTQDESHCVQLILLLSHRGLTNSLLFLTVGDTPGWMVSLPWQANFASRGVLCESGTLNQYCCYWKARCFTKFQPLVHDPQGLELGRTGPPFKPFLTCWVRNYVNSWSDSNLKLIIRSVIYIHS